MSAYSVSKSRPDKHDLAAPVPSALRVARVLGALPERGRRDRTGTHLKRLKTLNPTVPGDCAGAAGALSVSAALWCLDC